MPNRTRETQLNAWDDLQPKLGPKRRAVLDAVNAMGGRAAAFELVTFMRQPVNTVTGRITELCDLGLLADKGIRKVNPASGKKVIVWCVENPRAKQLDLGLV